MIEDLRWFGFNWEEPMISQSDHMPMYRDALETLHTAGLILSLRSLSARRGRSDHRTT